MANLMTNKIPNSVGAAEAFHIDVGVKLALLYFVFGMDQVDQMKIDFETGNAQAYLNAFGANMHLFSIGGNFSDPIYNFRICGHHQGEASDALNKLVQANNGEFFHFNANLKRAA